jgi:DNA invertase Pin-like site-specific DNA recombinase
MNIGYKRVSTAHQDNKRQELVLEQAGIKIDKWYSDKASAKNADRPGLNKLRLEIKEGDKLHVESISRLARNVDDLRQIVEELKGKDIPIYFFKEGFNTENDNGMYKFMLTLLGAIAEMERTVNTERILEGLQKAKLYGTRSGRELGRPKRILPAHFKKYYRKWKADEITGVEFGRLMEVSRPTLYRMIKQYEDELNAVSDAI